MSLSSMNLFTYKNKAQPWEQNLAPSYANLFMGDLELQLLELAKPYIHMWKDLLLISSGYGQALDNN